MTHIQTPALTIIDDFLPTERALEVRSRALDAGFEDIEFMQGTYQGTGLNYNPPDMVDGLARFFGRPVVAKVSAFRSGHEKTDLHVNIHADNVITKWAAVYYLNLPEQCKGGTAFYRLKETGWDQMPTQEQLEEKGKNLEWMLDKWTNEDAWDRETIAGMKFNRLIFYPSQYFHSRFPLKGWGATPEEARLIWVCFFDIL